MAIVRRLLRGQDGVVRLVFVDPKTGQQFLTPPAGQEIVDADGQGYLDLSALGLDPVKRPDKPSDDDKTSAERIKENVRESDSGATGEEGGSGFGRSTTNNFGYVNAPGIMGLIGLAPGMVGMVGKGINAGINANNVAAINEARGVIGLDPLGPTDMGKGFLGVDKGLEHGKIADVSIGKNTYSVGLEALDEAGRTTLTPEEASKRAAVMGVDINEVSREDGKGKGLISQAASFIAGLFGPDDDSSEGKGFPDAPSRTGTDDTSVDMAGGFGAGYGSGYGVGGVGTSQAAGYSQAAESMSQAGVTGIGGGNSNSNSNGVGYGEGGVGTSQSQGYGQAAESMGQAGMSGVGDTSSEGGNQSGNSDSDSDK